MRVFVTLLHLRLLAVPEGFGVVLTLRPHQVAALRDALGSMMRRPA